MGLVPASLERSTYIWIASLLLIAVCALWTPVPDVAWDVGLEFRIWSLNRGLGHHCVAPEF